MYYVTGLMMTERKSYERIAERLPQLEKRHAARLYVRAAMGGDTPETIESFFHDLNELKWLLVAVQSNSLPALKMFTRYLEYFECTFEAWKLRVITKRKFPNATIKTRLPKDTVILAPAIG